MLYSPSLWRVYFPIASVFAVKGKLLACHFIPLCSQFWYTPFSSDCFFNFFSPELYNTIAYFPYGHIYRVFKAFYK